MDLPINYHAIQLKVLGQLAEQNFVLSAIQDLNAHMLISLSQTRV